MIKVIEIIYALKDGGAETLVKDYVDLIDKQKFEVSILEIYPTKNTANYRQVSEMGIQIKSVYQHDHIAVKVFHKIFGRWYVPFRLKRILDDESPDCIHINSPIAWLFTSIQSTLDNIRMVYTCHSEPDKYFAISNKREESTVKKLVRGSKMRLIALHDEMRNELDRRFSVSNTVVVNNGVNHKRYRQPDWDAGCIRRSAGIPEDAFLVVHVGRFVAVKNHMFLLDVFSEIKQKRTDAHLLLIGDGPLKKNICEKINQNCLNGSVTILSHRTDVPELLHASDLVIFPSHYEGLSVALVEAQVTGLRCVISDTVNEANFLAADSIPLNLNLGAKEWARIALDKNAKNNNYGDLQQFNLEREIRKLESIYSDVEEYS